MGQKPARDKAKRKSVHLLFVCDGNTCRSPMAAGLFGKMLGKFAHVESAGIDGGGGNSARREAVQVMRELDVDIRAHRSRDVSSIPLSKCDYVVAMDADVSEHLLIRSLVGPDRLVSWDIQDPWEGGIDAYRGCVEALKMKFPSLQEILRSEQSETTSPKRKSSKHRKKPPQAKMSEDLEDLREYVRRGLTRLELGEVEGSHVSGVATTALGSFEPLSRKVLSQYLSACSLDNSHVIRECMRGRPKKLHDLTLGDVIVIFEKYNSEFTNWCRSGPPGLARPFENRTVATRPQINKLTEINKMRNKFYHHHPDYAGDERTLSDYTRQVLILMEDVLADPMFDIGTKL